ncbi:MAG TPA: TrkA family potassium uptake protein [Clostridia bacterium]|nr:TrkA family potassium uptake protein [Clostridia bacterium]
MKVIIIGGGQVGAYIAKMLVGNNCSVKLIENREDVCNRLKQELPEDSVVLGSGTDPNVLEQCGIAGVDVLAAVTGADEVNLVASTISKFEFAVPRVIARVNNPKNSWLFNVGMGVDVGLNMADLMGHLVVEEMDLKNMLTLLKLNRGNYSIVQIKVDGKSAAVKKSLKDLDIPAKSLLIALYRGKEVIIPRGNTSIMGDDNILAFADENSQIKLNALFGNPA